MIQKEVNVNGVHWNARYYTARVLTVPSELFEQTGVVSFSPIFNGTADLQRSSAGPVQEGLFQMTQRLVLFFGVLVIAIVAFAASPSAQGSKVATKGDALATASSWTPLKTPDGQPDIQGIYGFADRTPFDLKKLLEKDKAAGLNVAEAPSPFYSDRGGAADRRKSQVVFPADGKVPITDTAKQAQTERMDRRFSSQPGSLRRRRAYVS